MAKPFAGCDENCFECGYPDCIKPMYLMRSPNDEEGRGKKNRKEYKGEEGESR